MRLGAKNPLNGAGNLNRSGGTAVEYDTTLAFNQKAGYFSGVHILSTVIVVA